MKFLAAMSTITDAFDPNFDMFQYHGTIFGLIADWEVLVAAILLVLFTSVYIVFFKWTKTDAGKSLVAFLISLILTLGLIVLARFVGPDYFARDILRLIVYSGIMVSSAAFLWTLIKYVIRNTSSFYNSERSEKIPKLPSKKDKLPVLDAENVKPEDLPPVPALPKILDKGEDE